MSYDYHEDGDEDLDFQWLKRSWEWAKEQWLFIFVALIAVLCLAFLGFGIMDTNRREKQHQSQLRQCEAGDMAACAECGQSVDACQSHLRAYFHKEKGE